MPVSTLLLTNLQTKYGKQSTTQDIVSYEYTTQRSYAYNQLKLQLQQIQIDAQLLQHNTKSALAREQSVVSQKYDDAFFDDIYSMLDTNVEPGQLFNKMFTNLSNYEIEVINQSMNVLYDEYGQKIDVIRPQARGTVHLGVGYNIKVSQVAGFVAGALVSLIPKVASIVAMATSAAGPIIGALFAAIIGGIIYFVVETGIREFLNSVGWGSFNARWIEHTLFHLSGWLVFFNWSYTINITSILDAILG
jgi:hypothetical protein